MSRMDSRESGNDGGRTHPLPQGKGWIAAEAAMTGRRGSGQGAHQGRPYGLICTYPSQERGWG